MTALALFVGFFRVGLLGFGGGNSMLPLMEAECIAAGWVTKEQFLEGIAVGSALPGPITVKMAVYVGWQGAGAAGALSAVLGVITPAIGLMSALGGLLLKFGDHPVIEAGLRGAKAAVVGMLFFVAWDLAQTGVTTLAAGFLAAAAFAALVAKVHPGLVMLGAMAIGAVVFRG